MLIYIYIYVYIYISIISPLLLFPSWALAIAYRLLIACPSIAYRHGPGPGTTSRAQKLLGRDLGDCSFWALGPGPGPISIVAEHMYGTGT